jgi:TPR repeat protein
MNNTNFVSPLSFWAQAVGAAGTEAAVTRAVKAYQRGDYEDALVSFAELAENGNGKAQYYLGEMYANGQGSACDVAVALEWLRKAAHGGFTQAQERLGEIYRDGALGIVPDGARAYAWLDIAAGTGSSKAALARDVEASNLSPAELKRGRSLSTELAAKPLYLLGR